MPQVVIVADDLTGAADTGGMFVRRGLTTMVALGNAPLPNADVLVLSTESRHISSADAVSRVKAAVGQLQTLLADAPWVYKKVDSTLRGHPGVELSVLMTSLGLRRAVVAPAFPAQGRTTIAGHQWVHGVRLDQTVFGKEVGTSDVCQLFTVDTHDISPGQVLSLPTTVVRKGIRAISHRLESPGWRVYVADAEMEADLNLLMAALFNGDIRLLCGSAGFAQALAGGHNWVSQISPPTLPSYSGTGALVVAGSRHPQTIRQVEMLKARGAVMVTPEPTLLMTPSTPIQALVDSLVRQFHQFPGVVVLTTAGLPYLADRGTVIAERLALVVRALSETAPPAGLVLTGGDIAAAVSRGLAAEALWLQGEVQPGIPKGVLLGGVLPGVPLITKAGGFGDDETLWLAAQALVS